MAIEIPQEDQNIFEALFGTIAGWFGKPKDKIEYDRVRQEFYNNAASLVDRVDGYRAAGQLTRPILEGYISALSNLLSEFSRYTASVSSSIGNDWVQPRFHDYYDFFMGFLRSWQSELLTLPGGSIFDDIFGTDPPVIDPVTGLPPVQTTSATIFQSPVVMAGLALGAIFLLTKKGR